MLKDLSLTWDLDVIFPGGSESQQFKIFLDKLESDLKQSSERLADAEPLLLNPSEALHTLTQSLQDQQNRIVEALSFTSCLSSQDVKDQRARALTARVTQLYAAYQSVLTSFDQFIVSIPDQAWEEILQNDPLCAISFPLTERRRLAIEKLPPEQESLVNQLSVDGYHAWSELYDTIVGRISIPVEEDGQIKQLSVGQAFNKLSNANRAVRVDVFSKWEAAWAEAAELCAAALNHLAGFRLNLYRSRGWDSFLKEPLDVNRMQHTTLQTMWDVIDRNKSRFVDYLNKKAELLNLKQLGWEDVTAPLSEVSKVVSYDEGAAFILEQFRRFSPKLADFAAGVFEDRWIEAEDRPNKRPGGFCTSFPLKQQSRIFMTYSGTTDNVSTLAHELGHAYHQHVMDDMPPFAQNYAMNVAETASTLAERIVIDAAIQHALNDQEKIVLLDEKIQNSIAFYMNIHARFLFETSFYERRKQGLLSVDELNELMEQSQAKAYCGALKSYHPHFWASKLHFYITDVPFYNFPYTFGYLFSTGIYALAVSEGISFEQKYINLLRDTGSMTVEDLASKHLGVDLTQPDFWQNALDLTLADVEEFLRLAESVKGNQ